VLQALQLVVDGKTQDEIRLCDNRCSAAKHTREMNWLKENHRWVFDGIGVAIGMIVLSVVGWTIRRFFFTEPAGHIQRQRSGAQSTNMQAGRDIKLGGTDQDDRR
jgi:hypothetical protein